MTTIHLSHIDKQLLHHKAKTVNSSETKICTMNGARLDAGVVRFHPSWINTKTKIQRKLEVMQNLDFLVFVFIQLG